MSDVESLITGLDAAGDLPAGFGPLLRAVPRERYLPNRIWTDRNPVDRHADPATWRTSVYSDLPIVTQYDDGETTWPDIGNRPTCSASMPSVVTGMLDALDLRDGQTVLEIGTGTGFNAALLAEIVGSRGRVYTVEQDQRLHRDARTRLAGYEQLTCLLGDGTQPVETAARFDRVICTASVHLGRIPGEWVRRTRPGGVIVTPVRADLASGPLVRFVVGEDGTATGRTLPMGVGFMEVRSQRTAETPDTPIDSAQPGTAERSTPIDPRSLLDTPAARWALAVGLPSCRYDIEAGTGERPYDRCWLRDPITDAWASIVPHTEGRHLVRQGGIRRLWDEAETAYLWWQRQGEPPVTGWEWTIAANFQGTRPIR